MHFFMIQGTWGVIFKLCGGPRNTADPLQTPTEHPQDIRTSAIVIQSTYNIVGIHRELLFLHVKFAVATRSPVPPKN
jgi:hypothetical protein